MPSFWLILATLVGGSLAAGSANAMNMYLDRDIDELMKRTRQRPLPAHAVTPEQALRFGFVLGAVSFLFLVDRRERAGRDPRALGDRLLRVRLHDVAQALHRAEHRDRRRGRRGAGARRLGGGDRAPWRRPRGSCSRSSSSGPRRTSGRSRCASAATTRRRACRCSRWSRATTRPGGRSSCTRWRCSGRRSCCTRSRRWARSTWPPRSAPAGSSSTGRSCCGAGPSADGSWALFKYSIVYLAALFGAVALDALV